MHSLIVKNISISSYSVYPSSSSCRAASTDIPDPLSPLLPIVHCLWQVFRATSCILTAAGYMFELVVLLLLGHMWGSIASPAVSCMSGSSNLDSFRDGRQVVGVLWGGAVRTCSILLATFLCSVLIQPIQFSISTDFVYTQLNVKTVLY